MQGLVANALMTTPGMAVRYLERVASLRTNVFLPDRLTNRVHELARSIRPTLAAYGPEVAEAHDERVAALCERIVARAQSIAEQLVAPHAPIPFDAQGVAKLADWKPRPEARRGGEVHFDQVERDGRAVLRITVGPGGGVGAWRSLARLEAGSYRFEGDVQTRDVGAAGIVSLRLGAWRDPRGRSSDNAWSRFSHAFTVYDPLGEVELRCELRSARGEAWFDLDSLRIVRE